MNFVEKSGLDLRSPSPAKQERPKEYFRARPCGELDVDALVKDVKRRYPKILAHLAE